MKPRRSAWLLLLLPVLATCGGGERPPVPGIASAVSERDVEDGAARQSSTITVEFDRPLKLAKQEVPLASRFELQVPGLAAGGTRTRRVLVSHAEMPASSQRTIVLRVDALVPSGTVLSVAKQAFDGTSPGELTAEVKSSLTVEAAALATLAFTFGDPGTVADRGEPVVTGTDRDAASVRAQLEAHLAQRGSSAETNRSALALYDGIPASTVPGPKARAALAALTGTFAEPAIGALLRGENCGGVAVSLVVFAQPPDFPNLLARVTTGADGRRTVSISPALESERFELLMPILAHEAIHCDSYDGKFEEVAATAFDTFFYLNLLAIDGSLATGKTKLARDLAIDAVAMLNSGRRLPESVGVLQSTGIKNALPGSNNQSASFAEFVAASYPEVVGNSSPDEPVANLYAQALAGVAGMPAGRAFDLRYLDEVLGRAIDPLVIAGAIEALSLVPSR